MADEQNKPKLNLTLDLTDLAGFLVDLPSGGLVGLRTEKDDFPGVMKELERNQEDHGKLAGVEESDLVELQTYTKQIAQIDSNLPAALKIAEILQESRAKLIDARERKASNIAKRVKLAADDKQAPELLATYESTIDYPNQIAEKAAKTRKKNAEEKK
jgi:hypothetical protein